MMQTVRFDIFDIGQVAQAVKLRCLKRVMSSASFPRYATSSRTTSSQPQVTIFI